MDTRSVKSSVLKRHGLTGSVNISYTFSNLGVEAAVLKAKEGLSDAEISRRLHMYPPSVNRALKRLDETANIMREAVQRLQDAHYYERKYRPKVRSEIVSIARQAEKRIAAEGLWPSKAPRGYILSKGSRMLQKDPKLAPVIQRVFQRVADGDEPWKAAGDEDLPRGGLYRLLRNPVYKGQVRYDGESFRGRHEPLVDEKTWNKTQENLRGPSIRLPFGFRRSRGNFVPDSRKEYVVRRIYRLRVEGKTRKQIARELGLGEHLVYLVLGNPLYKQIVGSGSWEAAQVKLRTRKLLSEPAA